MDVGAAAEEEVRRDVRRRASLVVGVEVGRPRLEAVKGRRVWRGCEEEDICRRRSMSAVSLPSSGPSSGAESTDLSNSLHNQRSKKWRSLWQCAMKLFVLSLCIAAVGATNLRANVSTASLTARLNPNISQNAAAKLSRPLYTALLGVISSSGTAPPLSYS